MKFSTAEGNCCKDGSVLSDQQAPGSSQSPKQRLSYGVENSTDLGKEARRASYLTKCRNAANAGKHKAAPKPTRPNKKNKKGRNNNKENKYQPHFGLESLSTAGFAIEALARFANIDIPDTLLREVEGVILLLVNLTQQTTALGAVTSILTWVQGRTSKSLFSSIKGFIEETLVSSQSSTTPEWLDCLRDVRQNWELCKNNRAFKQISKLLGCLVMLGLCDVSDMTFSIGGYKLFTPELCDKHMTALDMVDAVFETVVFFTEGAYLCFQNGSLRPLLVNDRTAMELDAEYARVVAWFDLVKNGNLHKFSDISDQEFEKRLNRLSASLLNLSQSLKGIDKKLVMDKVTKVLSMQNDYVAIKVASGVRHAPWAIELFGESSQGKTTLGDQLIDAVLLSQGLPIDKEFRCAYNAGDKFMSNWTSDKLVMIFDDMSNEKSQFVERPPTRAIIDVINNQMYYAPKAELDAKGKCFVEPWIAVATTNKKDLDAGLYSHCPYSIQRRLTCITVKAKPEFQRVEDGILCGIDPTKVREHYTDDKGVYNAPAFDDIWSVTIEKAVKPPSLTTVATYKPITWNGKVMKDISMGECIQWAIEDFDAHRKNQIALLEGMNNRATKLVLCGKDGCKHLHGNCPYHDVSSVISRTKETVCGEEEEDCDDDYPHELDDLDRKYCMSDLREFGSMRPHLGPETIKACTKLWYTAKRGNGFIDRIYERADRDLSEALYKTGLSILSNWNWIWCIPAPVLDMPLAKLLLKWMYKDDLVKSYRHESTRLVLTFIFQMVASFMVFNFYGALVCVAICFMLYLGAQKKLLTTIEERLFERLKRENLQILPIVQRYRDEYVKHICGISVGIAVLYGLSRAYKAYRKNQRDSQGSLEPKTELDVSIRDAEVNVWTGVTKRDLPITDYSKRMSSEMLGNIVTKALVYGSVHRSDGNGMVNGLFLSSNVILIPNHYFDEFGEELNCTFRKRNPENSGGKFAARLYRKYSHLIPNSDLRVCYVSTGGSFKNLVNFFPVGDMPSVPFRMFWRKKDGEMIEAKGVTVPQVVETVTTFNGGNYRNLTIDTFEGLCGATLVSDTNGAVILGVHLGGIAGTPVGCYGSITQQQLFDAFAALRRMEGILLTGSAGKFETTVLGVQVLKEAPLHPKSSLNYLPENSQIEYFGSCGGRSEMHSAVQVTPISEHIVDVCGVPNIYGPPKFKPDWFGWQECAANLAVPALPFDQRVLEIAIKDYKEPLLEVFQNPMWSKSRPLTDKENICGIPGQKFMDAIKLNTSVGFPLSGPKREFVIELEPTEEFPNNREFEPVIMEEIRRVENLYKKGERAYPIAKACKKDEILTKPKCRIFYGNALSLTFLVRKYYLPILRVLQFNPLLSECAVGINAHGPEWEALHQYVHKFGRDRLFGGDYGKYDQKLPSQLIIAALRILIDFARLCDYSEEDLLVMEAMVGDIVYAYIAYNGDLIGLTEGTHISGNSLTVIINGICGSLNLRTYFYTMNKPDTFESRKKFRDYVAAMTYGDDNIGSVSKSIENFTIKGCSEFLAQYGQVYTMPDKESELLDFLPPDEFEFLKRKSVYHPKLGVHVGALIDKSVYKSLHCFMREKNCPETPEFASAINVDGALREWFNHGEEKYEQQRALMTEVATRAGIKHMCTGLNLTYNERVADWQATYGPKE